MLAWGTAETLIVETISICEGRGGGYRQQSLNSLFHKIQKNVLLKSELINIRDTSLGQRKDLSHRQELNPWPFEHRADALSTARIHGEQGHLTEFICDRRPAYCQESSLVFKWITMANFTLGEEMCNVNWSTWPWHERGTTVTTGNPNTLSAIKINVLLLLRWLRNVLMIDKKHLKYWPWLRKTSC